MNVSRFKAADMRQAIRQVKDELGPDAVILSNKKVEDGIEIIAASDYDESLLFSEVKKEANKTTKKEEDLNPESTLPGTNEYQAEKPTGECTEMRTESQSHPVPSDDNSALEIDGMRTEIIQMRSLLEDQLAHFAWGELKNKQPVKSELLCRLERLKLDQSIIKEIISITANAQTNEVAWQSATDYLCKKLPIFEEDVLAEGGAIALVGATGVGKTTSIAKLAARYILRYGPRHMALVTTDGYRIGAYDQLLTFGQILGVPVQVVSGKDNLTSTLQGFLEKRLVLIDTAGMSQRDTRLQTQMKALTSSGIPVKTLLVLSATTQRSVIEQTIDAFASDSLSGIIVTKVDEAASMGELISILIKKNLPVAFVGDGQRVPEDLRIARSENILDTALELSDVDEFPADGVMARNYGEVVSHAAI